MDGYSLDKIFDDKVGYSYNDVIILHGYINFSVNNIFNTEYVSHLSRIKDIAGGVPNPGRSFNMSLKLNF